LLNLKEYSGLFNLSDLIRFNKWLARGICLKIFLLKRNSLKVFTPRYIFILALQKNIGMTNLLLGSVSISISAFKPLRILRSLINFRM
jgi:hypothetical protein